MEWQLKITKEKGLPKARRALQRVMNTDSMNEGIRITEAHEGIVNHSKAKQGFSSTA